jgi:hypothetical protein
MKQQAELKTSGRTNVSPFEELSKIKDNLLKTKAPIELPGTCAGLKSEDER